MYHLLCPTYLRPAKEHRAEPRAHATRLISHVKRRDALATLACLAALTAILLVSSFAGHHVFSGTLALFGIPRWARAGFSTVGYLALAIVAYIRPQELVSRAAGFIALGTVVASCALLAVGYATQTVPPFVCGMALHGFAYVWMTFLFSCQLVHLPSLKLAAVAVVGGVILRQLLLPLYSSSNNIALGLAVVTGLSLLVIWFLTLGNATLFRSLATRDSLELLELTNPLSSLRPPAMLFAGVLLVSVTYNFANMLGVPGLSVRRIVVVLMLFALLWALLVQREGQEDRLFSLVVLFIMAGMLLAPLLLQRDAFIAHTCLWLGYTSFSILLWLLVWGLGRRNLVAMLPVFALISGLDALGNLAGSLLGQLATALVSSSLRGTQAVILGLALFFFAFVWLGFKRFSFAAAIRGVEAIGGAEDALGASNAPSVGDVRGTRSLDLGSVGIGTGGAQGESARATDVAGRRGAGAKGMLVPAGNESPSPATGGNPAGALGTGEGLTTSSAGGREERLESVCQQLAERGGLTTRETEVLALLARGRNARFIMDELHVTRNTAKAHIAHIYVKLGVHSHQELLSCVEREA